MKFQDLPLGQRFEFQGEVYTKTGPLIATRIEGGKQKFMARYALVKVAGEAAPAAPARERLVRIETVVGAFEAFYTQCLDALAGADREAAREKLARGRQEFLDSLH